MAQTRLGYYQGIEQTYPAPFPAINAVVYDFLSVQYDKLVINQSQSPGITIFKVRLPRTNTAIRLHVMHAGEQETTIRIRPYLAEGQTLDAVLNDPEERQVIGALCFTLQRLIIESLRRTYPALGTMDVHGVTPPFPTLDQGWETIFDHQATWRRTMSDKELARQIGVEHSTVRNARSRLNPVRVARGRQNKNK